VGLNTGCKHVHECGVTRSLSVHTVCSAACPTEFGSSVVPFLVSVSRKGAVWRLG
jgi:hypothetical protein